MMQLVYLSSTRWLWTAEDVASILASSLRNNARDNITGILLYRSGSVMQLLEGDDHLVRQLFKVIKRDERHHRITLLFEVPVTERDFAGWSMAYRNLEVEADIPMVGHSRLLDDDFDMSSIQPARARHP